MSHGWLGVGHDLRRTFCPSSGSPKMVAKPDDEGMMDSLTGLMEQHQG